MEGRAAAFSEVRPDHGMMIPLGIVDPDRNLAVAPFYLNTVFAEALEPAQSYDLGRRLRAYVEVSRPQNETVAILAGGGLSHWLGVPEEGRVNAEWDEGFIADLIEGRGPTSPACLTPTFCVRRAMAGLRSMPGSPWRGPCPAVAESVSSMRPCLNGRAAWEASRSRPVPDCAGEKKAGGVLYSARLPLLRLWLRRDERRAVQTGRCPRNRPSRAAPCPA
uniref:DODA-type extradiol aromatic ring-opening family dioxygenase n=1 Tax=Brevundimonas sp. LF-1 TaxID=3126100 RepID=UPI00403E0148